MFKNQMKNCSNLTPLPFFYYLVIFQQQKFNYNFFYKFLKIKHYVNDEQYIRVNEFYNTISFIKKCARRGFKKKNLKMHECKQQNTTWD